MPESIGRRGLLGVALLATTGAAGCGSSSSGTQAPARSQSPGTTTTTAGPVTSSSSSTGSQVFGALEKTYDARLGVYALDTATGTAVSHRAAERFAMCSTFKLLAVGTLLKETGTGGLSRTISYGEDDLVDYSPVTGKHTSMSLGDLCAAALRYSDNTAANLILEQVAGPEGVTRFVRTLDDDVTRLDRIEPALNEATPGDERDTSTPQHLGTDLFALLQGATLTEVARRRMKNWMLGNTTGDARIRAAVPKGWQVADKTGTGSYGTANDVAVIYPSGGREPIVLSVLSDRAAQDAAVDEKLLAAAAQAALEALGV